MDKPFMPYISNFISMSEGRRGVWEEHEVWENVHFGDMINKTFFYDSTIRHLSDFNIIGSEDNLLRRPSVGHLVDWQEAGSKTWDIKKIIEGTMVNIYSTLPFTFSFRIISQYNFRTIWIIKRGEGFPCRKHVSQISRINDKGIRSYSDLCQCMNSILVFKIWCTLLIHVPLGRVMLFFSRSWFNISICFFMQELLGWKPLP